MGPGGRRGLDLSLPGPGTRAWPAQLPQGLRRWAWLGPCQAGVLPLPTTLLRRGAGGVPPRHTLSLPRHPCSGLSAPAQTPPQLPLGPLAGLSPNGCPGGSQESGPPGAMLPARRAAPSWALVRVTAMKGEGSLSSPSGAHCSHQPGGRHSAPRLWALRLGGGAASSGISAFQYIFNQFRTCPGKQPSRRTGPRHSQILSNLSLLRVPPDLAAATLHTSSPQPCAGNPKDGEGAGAGAPHPHLLEATPHPMFILWWK